mmetsp:Transcript_19326/g.42052  ORF Transcript_19326/g.42052 Transcript_19326/m.42052 type:complete len:104 (+) Transcript_19326:759-1070(+)
MDQIGIVLPQILKATAHVLEAGNMMVMKLKINNGFWQLVYVEGEEWSFSYILSNQPGSPIEILVPSVLQMGWLLSPSFFCPVSETAQALAQSYIIQTVGCILP